jgi:hypothetical protein
MTALSWAVTLLALVVVLTGCKSEKTSDEPRPAVAERTMTNG